MLDASLTFDRRNIGRPCNLIVSGECEAASDSAGKCKNPTRTLTRSPIGTLIGTA